MKLESSLPSVAIITVNYNSAAFIHPFLDSLAALTYSNWRLIVVDCGSTDGSAERIALRAPRAVLVRLNENRGITGGNNAGILIALADDPDYLLFLNPDTRVTATLLSDLLAFAGGRRLVAPCVLLESAANLMDDNVGDFDWRFGVWRHWRFRKPQPHGERSQRVAMASLVCLLAPAQAVRELGSISGHYMDDRYFMYYDDFDFVRRMQALGCEAVYAANALVYHRKSASGGGVDSPFKHYYATRNRLLLLRSVSGASPFALFFLYFLLSRIVRVAQALADRRPAVATAIMRGLVDFMAGRTGRTMLPPWEPAPHGEVCGVSNILRSLKESRHKVRK